MKSAPGASGSPLFLSNGEVIGINNSYLKPNVYGDTYRVSLGIRADCLWELLFHAGFAGQFQPPINAEEFQARVKTVVDRERPLKSAAFGLCFDRDGITATGLAISWEERINACERALELDPDMRFAHFQMGRTILELLFLDDPQRIPDNKAIVMEAQKHLRAAASELADGKHLDYTIEMCRAEVIADKLGLESLPSTSALLKSTLERLEQGQQRGITRGLMAQATAWLGLANDDNSVRDKYFDAAIKLDPRLEPELQEWRADVLNISYTPEYRLPASFFSFPKPKPIDFSNASSPPSLGTDSPYSVSPQDIKSMLEKYDRMKVEPSPNQKKLNQARRLRQVYSWNKLQDTTKRGRDADFGDPAQYGLPEYVRKDARFPTMVWQSTLTSCVAEMPSGSKDSMWRHIHLSTIGYDVFNYSKTLSTQSMDEAERAATEEIQAELSVRCRILQNQRTDQWANKISAPWERIWFIGFDNREVIYHYPIRRSNDHGHDLYLRLTLPR